MNWKNFRFEDVKPGDIIRNKGCFEGYIVVEHRGTAVTAVRSVNVTNPDEWELLIK